MITPEFKFGGEIFRLTEYVGSCPRDEDNPDKTIPCLECPNYKNRLIEPLCIGVIIDETPKVNWANNQ